MKNSILTIILIFSSLTVICQTPTNLPDSTRIDCAVANKFLEITDATKTHFSENKPTANALSSFYMSGLGTEYHRSYREQLTESATSFYDELFKTIGMIMYDVKNGTNANRKAGMVMQVAFASSDLKNRKKQLCGEQ